MLFTREAAPVLQKQNYTAYNRGDMFVPSKIVLSPLMAAAIATPFVGHNPVHSVPVMYGKVKTTTIGSRGMATPIQGGVN